jgi:alpha-tubulin suppressor-like RCC1 family protein
LADAVAVSAGIRFSCAVRADGSVWCWGENVFDDGVSLTPQRVEGIADATAIAAGGAHVCALRATREIVCWGLGQLGQLGGGTFTNDSGSATLVTVSGISDATAITAGWNHTCALRADSSVWCWGGNGDGATGYGQLGNGTLDNAPSPVQVVGLANVIQVSAGGWSTCAVLGDSTAWCWGYGERGGLGDGASQNSATPVEVSGIDDAAQIAVGGWHACAIRSGGRVSCWGDNSWAGGGELGDGTQTDRSTPVDAAGLTGVNKLGLGFVLSYAIDTDRALWGWGRWHGLVPAPVLVVR